MQLLFKVKIFVSPQSLSCSGQYSAEAFLSPLLYALFFYPLQAGMQAVRENRYVVLAKDFEKGYKNNIKKDETEHEFYK